MSWLVSLSVELKRTLEVPKVRFNSTIPLFFHLVVCFSFPALGAALLFDTDDTGVSAQKAPLVRPWKIVRMDPDYAGMWVVAGDVDNDGEVEFVSAMNHNEGDVHYTATAVAHKLDGTILWRWGDPAKGRKKLHHDVALQIHDWDGDGRSEVVLLGDQELVELDGTTGKEKRRLPIEEQASDCLIFCDLTGRGRPTDFLTKTRYSTIWAYDREGKLLWKSHLPGGYRTAHQARPMDIDGDGLDEIMAGYALLNSDGSVRWVYESKTVDQKRGHLDCARMFRRGKDPQDTRIVLTCCGANNIAVINGLGEPVWETPGHHFESADVGRVFPDRETFQIVVDIDHRPRNESPLWVFDEEGTHLGQIMTVYCRHHGLVDWTGDGFCEMVVGQGSGIYDHRGRRICTLDVTPPEEGMDRGGQILHVGDMDGDGVPDVALSTSDAVYVFKNEKGRASQGSVPLGSGLNYTLY